MFAPSITVGITAYNAEFTVSRALNAALSQTVVPAQIVVVDDCSTDGTVDLITRYEREHRNIHVIRNQSNMGVSFSRNEIIKNAKGTFLAFFDDDDVSDPERLQSQYDRIVSYESMYSSGRHVICHTARLQRFLNGSTKLIPTMGESTVCPAPSGIAVANRILFGHRLANAYGACATSSQMARTNLYKEIGGFDERFRRSEDTELNVRLAISGCHFVGIGRPLVTQYMTATNDKALQTEKHYAIMVLEKHQILARTANEYRFAKKWLELKYDFLRIGFIRALAKVLILVLTNPVQSSMRIIFGIRNLSSTIRQIELYRASGTSDLRT